MTFGTYKVPGSSDEGKKIVKIFKQSMPDAKVLRVTRIQNKNLYIVF